MKKDTNNTVQVEKEDNGKEGKAPRYITKKLDFYCPISPTVMWHHGMHYKDCPLKASERDMPSCSGCKLRWSGVDKTKVANNERNRNRKNELVVENAKREDIPNIGRTYNSDKAE